MKCRGLALGLALALSACGSEEAAVPEEATEAAATSFAEPEIAGPERHVLAFGDSLFAGYNVGDRESYPAQLEAALRGQGLNVRVTNAGVSGDTSAAGLQRIAFVLDSLPTPPDLAIVELGGNDLLRGISPAETRENIAAILAELQERRIPALQRLLRRRRSGARARAPRHRRQHVQPAVDGAGGAERRARGRLGSGPKDARGDRPGARLPHLAVAGPREWPLA